MALPQAKADLTAAMMDRMPDIVGNGWLARARTAARARWVDMGLPVRRDEYWRFTDPAALTMPTPAFETTAAASDLFAADALTLVFVDGAFDADQSDNLTLEGAQIDLLSQAGQLDLHWAQDVFGTLEAAGHDPVPRPLAALATQTATEGLLIKVTGICDRPIRVRYASTGGQPVLHHVIKLDPGATLTLLEEGLPGARPSITIEADIADTATLHHLRLQGPEDQVHRLTHSFARLGQASRFQSFTATTGGALTRNETVVTLTGDDAQAHVAGTWLGASGSQDLHHDDTVFVTHDAVGCESRQVFKKVLRSGATGVFQGKILVKEGAQKTDGYQISQSLLLDDDAQFLAKPELEIYADDVACSHGSTTGAIDETALFYLRARGVPADEARNLLVLSFLAEAVEEIADDDLAEQVTAILEAWLRAPRG